MGVERAKKVSELCERVGEGAGFAEVAGFPTAEPGWDFARRGSISGVRGACRRSRFPGRRGVQDILPEGALKDLVRIVAS